MRPTLRDGLSDLLHQVRRRSLDMDRLARTAVHPDCGPAAVLHVRRLLVERLLRSATTREQVVGYACAAELGLRLDPPGDLLQRIAASNNFPLRVLFWTAQRRARRVESGLRARGDTRPRDHAVRPAGALSVHIYIWPSSRVEQVNRTSARLRPRGHAMRNARRPGHEAHRANTLTELLPRAPS